MVVCLLSYAIWYGLSVVRSGSLFLYLSLSHFFFISMALNWPLNFSSAGQKHVDLSFLPKKKIENIMLCHSYQRTIEQCIFVYGSMLQIITFLNSRKKNAKKWPTKIHPDCVCVCVCLEKGKETIEFCIDMFCGWTENWI